MLTGGTVLASNIIIAYVEGGGREKLMMKSTCLFGKLVLAKSAFYGIVWPLFYIKLLSNPRPNFYLLGSGSG